jgi:L-amino acid N-acyltransferase YncA
MSGASGERGRYPSHRETDVVLRDGSTVHIRPARTEDRERVEDYLIGLSDESRRLRFWGFSVDITDVATRAVDVDYVDHLTLLAFEGGADGTVVGGAQYMREGATARAEVSVSVADALQGHGLGSILIAHLAQAAQTNGVEIFVAQVLPENHRMIEVFRRTGFDVRIRAVPGEVEVEFPTEITDEAAHLLECYGVPTPRQARAANSREAAEVAASLGGPIALKAIGPVHKTEAGAVVLDLQPDEVLAAATAMGERVHASGEPVDGFLVQQMVAPGVEMLVGAVADPVCPTPPPGRRRGSRPVVREAPR